MLLTCAYISPIVHMCCTLGHVRHFSKTQMEQNLFLSVSEEEQAEMFFAFLR